ncbi:hypothetical protein, partial [Candidatus Binatus sp.]|uniref:hypothetical protein n=1 Tax=Candidatus Binatus sp. TaxID=2811406 RepID=UPI003BAF8822
EVGLAHPVHAIARGARGAIRWHGDLRHSTSCIGSMSAILFAHWSRASKKVVQRCFQRRNRPNLDALFAYQAFARIKAEFLQIISPSFAILSHR